MKPIRLMPIAGMNTVQEDAALQVGGDSPRLYVRDAVNMDITPAGKPQIRPGVVRVSVLPLDNLWHSALHGDTFATLGDQWVRVGPNWTPEPLALLGMGDVSHVVLNNLVCVAGPAGIYTYDGQAAQKLTIDTPPPPWVTTSDGALAAGRYGVAVAWLRGKTESAPSAITHVDVPDGGTLDITLPSSFDGTVTHARLYLTKPNGGELLRGEDYPIGSPNIRLPLLPDLGAPPAFLHFDPMPTGRYLSYWRGRLLTAKANVLRFSEALAYHMHDARHGFVQMPQRITFVMPVDSGIWVGQVDHVVFLRGAAPGSLELERKSARAPVPGSAVYLGADEAAQYEQGGAATVIWLADNGYVAGTASGGLVENTGGKLSGVTASRGPSVVFGDRLLTVVS